MLQVQIAKDSTEWNDTVEKSPFSVLFHRYELQGFMEGPLPLIIKEDKHCFLFPLSIRRLLKNFRLAVSPIYDYASILPDSEEALDLIPEALDHVADFLHEMNVGYLSTCAPTFYPKAYITPINSWFKERKANVQIMYADMMLIKNKTFEDIWKLRFNKNARYKVRKAKREGIDIIRIDTEEEIRAWVEDIHQCNLSALERQGRIGAYPDSHKEIYLSELISTKLRLGKFFNIYGAVYGNQLIAYMIVHEYNRLMELTKAMSHTAFLKKCPNDALIAHIIIEACKRGFDLVEYGLDRVSRGGKIPSLHPELQMFRSKFGFEEVPILIYRLGLNQAGRMIQHLFYIREHIIIGSGLVPESVRGFWRRLYEPKRRQLSSFLTG